MFYKHNFFLAAVLGLFCQNSFGYYLLPDCKNGKLVVSGNEDWARVRVEMVNSVESIRIKCNVNSSPSYSDATCIYEHPLEGSDWTSEVTHWYGGLPSTVIQPFSCP